MRAFLLALTISVLAPFMAAAQTYTLTPDFGYQGDSLTVTIMSSTPFITGSPTSGSISVYMGTYTGQGSGTGYTYFEAATSTITGASRLTSVFYIPMYQDSGYYDFDADFPYNYLHKDTAFYVNTNLGGNGTLGGTVGTGPHKTDSAPLANARIMLHPVSAPGIRLVTRADANGTYIFKHLTADSYSIEIEGYDNANAPTYTLATSNTNLTNQDLVIDNGVVYSGINDAVVDESAFAIVPSIFTNQVNVSYKLTAAANVELNVYDVNGKLVLANRQGQQQAGTYSLLLNTNSVSAAGIYFFEVRANGVSVVKKAVKQ